MSSSLQYKSLARLLTLNNQVHDLENELGKVAVIYPSENGLGDAPSRRDVAGMQEEIDRGVRASLATCWLGLFSEDG